MACSTRYTRQQIDCIVSVESPVNHRCRAKADSRYELNYVPERTWRAFMKPLQGYKRRAYWLAAAKHFTSLISFIKKYGGGVPE